MPIATQNWDGVTAPAIPAGWNVDSNYTTTSTLGGGIVPISTPNVLGPGGDDRCRRPVRDVCDD